MGIWKNFDEMEESLSLLELTFILNHKRKGEDSERHFAAAIQGIDLDKNSQSEVEKKIEEAKRRAAVQLRGEEEVQREEFAELGFEFGTA